MAIGDKIGDEKLQYGINREAAKISALSSGKIDKYEYLLGEEVLCANQRQITEQAKFTYSPLGKVLEKQTRIIVEQGREQNEAIEVHGKQLLKSSSEKESLLLLKQKEIFSEFSNERINTIQDLIKQIDFNNLAYYFKGESGPKIFFDY